MATRFYYSLNQAAPVAPAYTAEWEKTSQAFRAKLTTSKSLYPESLTDKSASENVSTQPYDVLVGQFVSGRLKAQTISGTVRGQLRVRESNTNADFCRALVIKVVSEDGSIVRGTLLSHFPPSLTAEWSTSLTNRYFPPAGTALTEVEAQDGDRLVIEVGFRSFNTSTTSYTGYINLGFFNGTDLPEDETTTSALNPWIEFSQDLVFQVELGGLGVVVASEDTKLGGLGVVVESGDLRIGGLACTVESADMRLGGLAVIVKGPPLFAEKGRRVFPLPASGTIWQSQTLKRVFPLPGNQD